MNSCHPKVVQIEDNAFAPLSSLKTLNLTATAIETISTGMFNGLSALEVGMLKDASLTVEISGNKNVLKRCQRVEN